MLRLRGSSAPGADERKPSVLGASLVYVAGTVVQRAFAILLLPVLTRVLSVSEFGLAGTATALGLLFAVLFGFGLSLTIARLYYDELHAARTTWSALLLIQAGVSGAFGAVAYLTGPLWAPLLGGIEWGPALQLAVLLGWASGLQSTVLGVLRAAQRPGSFVVLTLIQVSAGGALGLALATRWDAAGYIAGMTIGALLATAVGIAVIRHPPLWDRDKLVDAVRFSLPAMLHQLSSWGLDLADRLLVVGILGLSAAARYQIAYTAGAALMMLITSAQMAWSPAYMSRSQQARERLPSLLVGPVTAMAFAGTAALVLATPVALAVLAPASYNAPPALLALVAAATLARAPYFVVVVYLVDQKRTGRMAIASGMGVVLNIAANVALLPAFGLIGAGVAYVLAAGLMAVMVFYAAQQLSERSLHITAMAASWAAGCGVLVGLSQLPDAGVWIAARVGLIVTAGAAVALLALDLRDIVKTER